MLINYINCDKQINWISIEFGLSIGNPLHRSSRHRWPLCW